MKESVLQKQICDYLRVSCPSVIFWHVPNGQIMSSYLTGLCQQLFGKQRGREQAGRIIGSMVNFLKSIGLLPGVPDLALHWAGGNIIYIELKTLSGKTSDEQSDLHKKLNDIGFNTFVIRSFDQFLEVVRELKIPCRDALLHHRRAQA